MWCHKAMGNSSQLFDTNWKKLSIDISSCLKVFIAANYCRGKVGVVVALLWVSERFFCLSAPRFPWWSGATKRAVGRGGVCAGGWLVQEEVTCRIPTNAGEGWKKIKKSCFSELEDSLHDFPTVEVMSFQAEILLTIHMEIEGSGGADSHINLICPWMQFSVCPDPAWLKTLPVRPVCQTQRKKWKASTFQESAQKTKQFLVVSPERILSLRGPKPRKCLFVYLKF